MAQRNFELQRSLANMLSQVICYMAENLSCVPPLGKMINIVVLGHVLCKLIR